MNEEEKKAIEDIRNELTDEDRRGYMNKWFADDLEIILKLIEKQQKEIEKLRNNNKNLLRKLRNRVKEVKKLEKYSVYKKEFSTLNKKLQQKDKIIDELEYIFNNYQLCEYELTDCVYRKCEYIADDEIPPCKECIKQYYERKVENGN